MTLEPPYALVHPIRVTVDVPGNVPFKVHLKYGKDARLNEDNLHAVVEEALQDAVEAASAYGDAKREAKRRARIEQATAAPGEQR